MIREATAAIGAAASCAQLAGLIAQLLSTAKANKKEYQSLLRAIRCIKSFLDNLNPSSITTEANAVLGELEAVLQSAKQWVGQVSNTGPLLSLLKAGTIRDEFLRINRDLTNTFSILAAGEKLMDISAARSQLDQIQVELRSCKSEFFIQQAQASSKLKDVASAAREGHWPEELLQRRLLDQLRQVPDVAALQPEELLTEFRALQLMAMYNGEQADDIAAATQADKGKKCNMDADLEEFLVQQLCATLAPTVASTTNAPLNHEAAASAPPDYLCPISQETMVKPVMLVATGHSYEEANILQWLETKSTCPVTGSKLSSKGVMPNYSLQKAIQAWASSQGLRLPAAPTFTPYHVDQYVVVVEEMGLASGPTGMQQQQQQKAPSPGIPQLNAPRSGRGLRCTRTKWAVGLIAAVLVVSGLAAGLGIFLGVNRAKGGNNTAASGAGPERSPAPQTILQETPGGNNTAASGAGPERSPAPQTILQETPGVSCEGQENCRSCLQYAGKSAAQPGCVWCVLPGPPPRCMSPGADSRGCTFWYGADPKECPVDM